MACKSCKNDEVANDYECTTCLIENKTFLWCLITKINGLNLADDIITLSRDEALEFVKSNGGDLSTYIENRSRLTKNSSGEYYYSHKREVFTLGEVFPVDPDFERELTTRGRKASKWDVEYELFDADKLAEALKKGRDLAAEESKAYFENRKKKREAV